MRMNVVQPTSSRARQGAPREPASLGHSGRKSSGGESRAYGAAIVSRISATDIDTAVGVLSEAYSEVTVHLTRATRELRMQIATYRLPNVAVGCLEITSSTVRSGRYPLFAVCLPIRGQIQITTNAASAHVGGRSGVVVSPGCPVAVDYLTDDCRTQKILFEQSAVENELSMMLGMPVAKPLRFDFRLGLAGPPSPFQRALALLQNELDESSGLTTVPATSTRLGRLVIAGLLVSQPNNYSEELARPAALSGSRAIRSALELIEGRPSDIETVADIADAVGLSVRALDDGFQRFVGTPPMTYLRRVRMARVHEDLVAADPHLTTATIIARRWGFGHYGRFAAEYLRRYGRKPSETLKGR
jgi:AraC-like DNA-binding protein